ncbi:SDR family NAD(P)-dependent oxidoreductase [Thiofilum flexile]|uniref:SDR family NAD(P)-dependent oxidoreductase n=1 Tax=Thiofilum flexile TaxID=125627 RepID=UPI00035E0324|nr:SDR family NAD(P)-dependent oxidoreductase [Thiofilum flexile]
MARNVLVTGASSGIGYCVAKGLREVVDYQVYVTARKPEDIERLESEGFRVIPLDLASEQSVKDCVYELMLRTNSEIYAVFHNGGFGQAGALEDITREALEYQFAVNVFGWHQLTTLLLPMMRQKNEGRIIYNSSVLGFISLPFRGAYNASKHAVEGLADTLRLELFNTDIKVVLIEPGPITSLFRKNSLKMLRAKVNIEASVFRDQYRGAIARLEKVGSVAPFTLPPEAVLSCVLDALQNPQPKVRYRVTKPTKLFAILKRLLTSRWMDKVLLRVSKEENQGGAT